MENQQKQTEYLKDVYQMRIDALVYAKSMDEEMAMRHLKMLTGVMLANRFSEVKTQEEVMYLTNLASQLKRKVEEDLMSAQPMNQDAHQAYIHAYVSATSAVEYAKFRLDV